MIHVLVIAVATLFAGYAQTVGVQDGLRKELISAHRVESGDPIMPGDTMYVRERYL